jgi:Integrase core domain
LTAFANGVAERWIGSVRRELLDNVVVLGEHHLRRLLSEYVACYHDDRTHLGLEKATPAGRPVERRPYGEADIVAIAASRPATRARNPGARAFWRSTR